MIEREKRRQLGLSLRDANCLYVYLDVPEYSGGSTDSSLAPLVLSESLTPLVGPGRGETIVLPWRTWGAYRRDLVNDSGSPNPGVPPSKVD